MAKTYDGIIIGAGVMGASCAMHLASAGLKNLLVLEKGPGVGFGSTGKSSACIRQTYSNYEVCLMAYESLQYFKNWQEFTGLKEPRADFNMCGVIFLMDADDANVHKIMEIQKRAGVLSKLLDHDERRTLFPDVDFCSTLLDLEAEDHECAYKLQVLYESEGGFADPVGTTQDMLDVALGLGARVQFKTRVTGVLSAGGRVSGLDTDFNGVKETFHAPLVINCAGPWAMGMNDAAGVPLREKLVPTRNQIVCKRFPEQLKGTIPMVADMVNGVYFRNDPTGTQIVLGSAKEEDEQEFVPDPDNYNEVADAPFRDEKLTILNHRISTFQARGEITSYSGIYTVNQDDYHPIIDESELKGFYPVCGFSGHGFKLSPVVGMLVAQQVLGQWGRGKTDVPADFFKRNRQKLGSNWGGVMA
ncbi:MAG: FAD-dependent oxidoreductase [SAR324 cluster bacterium]|nr:FAD-dependent oxidoreductase [SAR324 cluster bacterium]